MNPHTYTSPRANIFQHFAILSLSISSSFRGCRTILKQLANPRINSILYASLKSMHVFLCKRNIFIPTNENLMMIRVL